MIIWCKVHNKAVFLCYERRELKHTFLQTSRFPKANSSAGHEATKRRELVLVLHHLRFLVFHVDRMRPGSSRADVPTLIGCGCEAVSPVVVWFEGAVLVQAQVLRLLVTQLRQMGVKGGEVKAGHVLIWTGGGRKDALYDPRPHLVYL